MSAKRPSTSSPKPRRSSPKPRTGSGNSSASGGRGRLWIAGGIALAVLLVWFGSASLRADRAIDFDRRARGAIERNDVAAAYRAARWAYVLAPRGERALTLGSLAYLRREYRAAERYFRTADREAAVRESARVGRAAAAARLDDPARFDQAVESAGRPNEDGVRLALAYAAIDGGALDRADALLRDDRPENRTVGVAKAIANGLDQPVAGAADLAAADSDVIRIEAPDPAFGRFLEAVTRVDPDAEAVLARALERLQGVSPGAGRRTVLAGALHELEEYSAAVRLAEQAVSERPDYREAWNVLAAGQLALGELDDAERSLEVSTDLDPGVGLTWHLRAELARQRGQEAEAEDFDHRAELLGYGRPT